MENLNLDDTNAREKRDIMLSLIALKVRLFVHVLIARDCPLKKSEAEKIAGMIRELSIETGDGSDERREIILNRLMALWKKFRDEMLSVK